MKNLIYLMHLHYQKIIQNTFSNISWACKVDLYLVIGDYTWFMWFKLIGGYNCFKSFIYNSARFRHGSGMAMRKAGLNKPFPGCPDESL